MRQVKPHQRLYWLFCFVCIVVIAEAVLARFVELQTITASESINYRRILLATYLGVAGFLLVRPEWLKNWRWSDVRVSPALLLGSVAIVISLTVNAQIPTTLVVAAPFLAKFVFYQLPRTTLSFEAKSFIVPLLVFATVPTLVFIAFPETRASMTFHDGTFTGFAGSRSDFGYLAGLATLIVVCERGVRLKVCLPFLLYGIWLTESRATIVALMLSIAVLMWWRRRAYIVTVSLLAACLIPPLILVDHVRVQSVGETIRSVETTRAAFFEDDGARDILYTRAINQALRDGVWFGSGRLYTSVYWEGGNREAHNAFLQSVLNLGIFVTLIWYWLLLKFWAALSGDGKGFVAFLVTFGMFQPGFEAWFFPPFVLFTFLLAAFYSQRSAVRKVRPLPLLEKATRAA